LIHGFCQVGDLDAAQDLLNVMISSGVAPNYITFQSMLASLCSKKELRKAFAILEDLQKSEVCPRIVQAKFKIQIPD